ncbi:MAG: asparagine synthase (glutamine-hydrolyzing) [Bacteroidota bacterium]
MCGIAGAVNFKIDHGLVNRYMFHRGPDEQNGFTADNVDFYHLRLSILDIGGGKQPMQLASRYTIIFNGEIYNHAEVRKQLNIVGKTSSDTETLLLLYKQYGPAMLDYLDGMFVLAIYDNAEKKIFIARDRAGKKPLYVYNDGNKIVFASELNCLKGLLPLQMQEENIYHYLRFGSFYKQLTPYKNVNELGAGSFAFINCTTLEYTEKKWWDIGKFYQQQHTDNFEQSTKVVDDNLHKAVRRRVESSDLEVGSFLSGGIDSGLVTAIASEYNNKLKTFTVSFEGEYDEAPLAKLVADRYKTHHTQINISFGHLKEDVEQILGNYGEPFFDSSAIPSYYVSKEARKHLTVILNGDGADELFGGYRRYVPFARYDFFKPNVLVKGGAMMAKNIMPYSSNKKSTYNYLYRLAALASKSNLHIYLSAGVDILEDYERNIIDPPANYLKQMQDDFNVVAKSNISGLKKLMQLDFDTNLFNDLLVKMDIASMANSLEGRSPFLSKELLEYAPGMNDNFKIKGSTTKYLLRQLAKKYLPAELINQPKRGFEIPLKKWVDNELKEIIFDYLSPGNAFSRQFVNTAFIDQLLAGKVKIPAEKRAKIIWTLFCLEVWHKKVYQAK